jgi:type IV pilus biogenesis protein CpaD/CtpE
MRVLAILVVAAIGLVSGCRSSEEAVSTTPPGAVRTGAAHDAESGERPLDDLDRYNRKTVDYQNRQDARAAAARERDRRIDEVPVQHPPESPPAVEKPPR